MFSETWRGCYRCLICDWTFKHHLLLSLWPLWASAVIPVHCNKKLLWQNLTAAPKYRHKHRYLEDSLMDTSCPFSKTTVMPSTLGLLVCSTWDHCLGFQYRIWIPSYGVVFKSNQKVVGGVVEKTQRVRRFDVMSWRTESESLDPMWNLRMVVCTWNPSPVGSWNGRWGHWSLLAASLVTGSGRDPAWR